MKSSSNKLLGYKQLLSDIRSLLDKNLGRAYQAVDNIRVQTYWQMGERIVREELKHQNRAVYAKQIIQKLSYDFGFSRRLMFEVVEFYKTYPIVHAVRAQLSWTHYGVLIRLKDKEQRLFYEVQILKNKWSYRELENRIRQEEYQKAKKAGKLDFTLPKQLPEPQEVFKDTYDWDFLSLEEDYSEHDLEAALIDDIRKTLLEFGYGFCFMGQQIKLLIAGRYHTIDLLFYHRDLQCVVIIDLKTERFKDAHVGQMNTYLNYFREKDKLSWERDPIGLIICKEKDDEEVHYALGKLKEDIFVAEYKTKLPSEREIQKQLRARR